MLSDCERTVLMAVNLAKLNPGKKIQMRSSDVLYVSKNNKFKDFKFFVRFKAKTNYIEIIKEFEGETEKTEILMKLKASMIFETVDNDEALRAFYFMFRAFEELEQSKEKYNK